MKELDLHGLSHEDVWDVVENFVLINNEELPLRIITGYSDRMKEIVTGVLDSYDYAYEVPAHNGGEVIVLEDRDKIYD
jgi:hypothetical protein